MHPIRSLPAIAFVAAAALLLASGCSQHTTEPVPVTPDVAPAATSPENALRRLQWAWVHRDPEVLRTVFTEDFTFVFGASDSSGAAWRDMPWGVIDESISTHGMFVGGATEPPATSLSLTLDPRFTVLPDPRAGHESAWHRTIRTTIALTFRTQPRSYEIQGFGRFYFVRGDSALIPPEVVATGVGPDPNRWWIDRWEDETIGGAALRSPLPATPSTLGRLKALYRMPL